MAQAQQGAATISVERGAGIVLVAALLSLSALAWSWVVRQSDDMAMMVSGLGHVGRRMPSDVGALLFVGMWVSMMAAMMLPTVLPMVLAHHYAVRHRGDNPLLTAVFVGGYLAAWTAVGVVPALLLVSFGHLSHVDAVAAWVPPAAGAVLLGAGLFQFTAWKAACLRSCRHPMQFLLTHDFGRGARGAFRAGVTHGAWCLGCCAALMSVLAVVGFMNLAWMAALSLVFLVEKTWRHGVIVSRVAGGGIALLGGVIVANPNLLSVVSAG